MSKKKRNKNTKKTQTKPSQTQAKPKQKPQAKQKGIKSPTDKKIISLMWKHWKYLAHGFFCSSGTKKPGEVEI